MYIDHRIGNDVSFDEPLASTGLDSSSALELKREIETEICVALPDTVEADIQMRVLQIMSTMVDRHIDIDEGFMDAGIDSLVGLELKTQMESQFEVHLPDTLFFDYPTPRSLSAYILLESLKFQTDEYYTCVKLPARTARI